jgi:hypothetical protein
MHALDISAVITVTTATTDPTFKPGIEGRASRPLSGYHHWVRDCSIRSIQMDRSIVGLLPQGHGF